MYYSAIENAFYADFLKLEYERAGTWPDDAVMVSPHEWEIYGQGKPPEGMQRGAGPAGRPTWLPVPPIPLADLAAHKRRHLETSRQSAEASGVVYESIRYAGNPSNRQALKEALDHATEIGQTSFESWKDSDGKFHPNHPVEHVYQALLNIATRRSQLIALEGELNAQIDAILSNDTLDEAEMRAALDSVEWLDD